MLTSPTDHVHTLEETLQEPELLLHLGPSGGQLQQQQDGTNSNLRGRGRRRFSSSSADVPPERTRVRCTSAASDSVSRVREIRGGEIVAWGCETVPESSACDDKDGHWRSPHQSAFPDTGGRTLSDDALGPALQRTFHRLYAEWVGVFKLVLVFAAGIFATTAWTPLSTTSTLQRTGHSEASRLRPLDTSITKDSLLSSNKSTVSALGQTVELDGVHYFVPGKAKHRLPLLSWSQSIQTFAEAAELWPITVVTSSATDFRTSHLHEAFEDYAQEDDVWSPAFSNSVLLHYNASSPLSTSMPFASVSANQAMFMSGFFPAAMGPALRVSGAKDLPRGPYFASVAQGHLVLYEAWRLYSDTHRAFFYGTVPHPKDDSAFSVLSASLPHANGVAALGVPSRLYYRKTDDKPLAGVRVSVKDLYDLKGTKTSMGSRAWLSHYPEATSTAPCIQRLIDLGAIIVGKTRLSQFATGQYGTADNVDFGVPFNVRGDGYQDPSSSSSGSGASAGAYGFIDLAIGSDTGGSVRAPAGVNGVYGNRPTQGATDLTGSLPLSASMDTAAILAAHPRKFAEYAKAFYGGNQTFRSYRSLPKQLLYITNPSTPLSYEDTLSPMPGFFPAVNGAAHAVYEDFVIRLEQFLGTSRQEIDFYAEFRSHFGVYPAEYIGPAWSLLTAHDQWTLFADRFQQEYRAVNDGDRPFIDPPVRKIWDYAEHHLSEANATFYLERKQAFHDFISDKLLQPGNAETYSNALAIFPLADGSPHYKSDYHTEGTIFNGFNKYSISQLGQVPEVVVPIGEVPFLSKLTQTIKYLPVSISIQAAAGCDFVLYDLLASLSDAGIIEAVKTGTSRTF